MLRSMLLLLVLLNPFLVVIYLVDMLQKLDRKKFTGTMVRGSLIGLAVFCAFALAGDALFTSFLNANFASFQIFGGIVFLLIGLQFVFRGPKAIEMLRGESEHLAGAIAMPILIGPGTLSACVIIGKRHAPLPACLSIAAAVAVFCAVIIVLKALHDYIRPRHEPLIERYIEIAGRITAIVVGTIAVKMIMQGLRAWGFPG